MWLYLAVLVGLYYLLHWHWERQVVSHLRDKYIFITGCDSGFGNQLARQLDMRGLRVLAACLTEKGAEELRDRTSDRLETVILDVTKTESIAAATRWVKERTGDRGLWGLVNNAGIAVPAAPNEWLTKDDFLKVLNVNLIGLIEVTLSFLPLIRKARRELCPFGVRVAIVVPGNFKTSICPDNIQDILKGVWSQVSPEVKKSYGDKYFEGYCQYYNNLASRGQKNLTLVTDCMEHALTAVHPRIRYSAGWDAACFTLPLSFYQRLWRTLFSVFLQMRSGLLMLCSLQVQPAHPILDSGQQVRFSSWEEKELGEYAAVYFSWGSEALSYFSSQIPRFLLSKNTS